LFSADPNTADLLQRVHPQNFGRNRRWVWNGGFWRKLTKDLISLKSEQDRTTVAIEDQ